jgi:hypothetical protein
MEGKIKKIADSTSDIYPVTRASAVYLNKDTTVEKKIRELEDLVKNNGGLDWLADVDVPLAETGEVLTHIDGVWKAKSLGGNMNIELETWGIKQGLPTKPYTEEEYKIAFDNIEGINKALVHAKEKGYSTATLPRGEYSICYPVSITLQSNLTFDLGGSRLKVMYDSINRSPYDRSSAPVWAFGGRSFQISDVVNAHLTNGEIIGEMYDRSFTNSGEVAVEHSYGVAIEKGAAYCSVRHCEIHGFAGDNIAFIAGGRGRGGMNTGAVAGNINETTGALEPQDPSPTNTAYSPEIIIDQTKNYKTFSLGGQGYSRTTRLNNKYIDVFYYKEDGTFIGVLKGRKVHAPITIPIGAGKLRMKFYDEPSPVGKDYQIFINWGSDAHHNVIEYNEIYNGHRGGLQLGGSYNVIQYNTIRDSGKYSDAFLDGFPPFNDTTRYLINQEDSYGDNSIIRYNHFSGGFHGLLLRAWSLVVEGNVFNNIGASAIVIYSTEFMVIRGNYVQGGGLTSTGSGLPGKVIIQGNFLSGVSVDNPDYDYICVDNHIVGGVSAGNAIFERNSIAIRSSVTFNGGHMKNNKIYVDKGFESKGLELFMYSADNLLEENEFRNLRLNLYMRTGKTMLKNCSFDNCHVFTTASPIDLTLEIQGGRFKDSLITPNTSSTPNALKCSIKDATFISSPSSPYEHFFNIIALTYNNVQNVSTLSITGCLFIIESGSILTTIIKHNYLYSDQTTIDMRNNLFEYLGEGVFYVSYFTNSRVAFATIADNKVKNVVFTNDFSDTEKFTLYNSDRKSMSEPTEGFFNKGQKIESAKVLPGSFMGWIALNEGYANDNHWTATTSYVVGDIVNANDKVYRCSVAGTSGSAAPSHDYTTRSATDGTVTWEYIGELVIFKPYGLISE